MYNNKHNTNVKCSSHHNNTTTRYIDNSQTITIHYGEMHLQPVDALDSNMILAGRDFNSTFSFFTMHSYVPTSFNDADLIMSPSLVIEYLESLMSISLLRAYNIIILTCTYIIYEYDLVASKFVLNFNIIGISFR